MILSDKASAAWKLSMINRRTVDPLLHLLRQELVIRESTAVATR